jgi:hypothetical protein
MFEAALVVPTAMASKAFQSSSKIDGNSVAEPFRASSFHHRVPPLVTLERYAVSGYCNPPSKLPFFTCILNVVWK